jgi:hypothetical protein
MYITGLCSTFLHQAQDSKYATSPVKDFFAAISSNGSSIADRFLDLVGFESMADVDDVERCLEDAAVILLAATVPLLSAADNCSGALTETPDCQYCI